MKFFLLLFTQFCIAQSANEFIGTIQLHGNNSIVTYKLSFEEKDSPEISGFSVTDFAGQHRTKSTLTGVLDRSSKTISFKETGNVSTLSNLPESSFCYVNVKKAEIKLRGEKSIIQGPFIGRYANGKQCAAGYVYLIGAKSFYNKINTLEKKMDQMSTKKEIPNIEKSKEEVDDMVTGVENNILRDGNTLKINWKSKKVVLEIWDDKLIDGDKISVYVGDKKVLDHFEIVEDKKVLTIEVPNTTSIRIVAENEGSRPPNTANVVLKDDDESYNVVTHLNEGAESTIQILK